MWLLFYFYFCPQRVQTALILLFCSLTLPQSHFFSLSLAVLIIKITDLACLSLIIDISRTTSCMPVLSKNGHVLDPCAHIDTHTRTVCQRISGKKNLLTDIESVSHLCGTNPKLFLLVKTGMMSTKMFLM